MAMYCLIQFYVQLRVDLASHHPFLKVVSIKLVIFLSFWQSFLISILTSTTLDVVKPSSKIAYPDLKVGIPSLLLCIEMAIFSFLHLFAFPYKPYSKGIQPSKYPLSSGLSVISGSDAIGPKQGGFLGLKAFVDALNPWDLVKGFGRGMKWLFVGRKHRENDPSYKNQPFSFGALAPDNDHDMTLGETGATDGGYRGAGLPIANEFRKNTFGMPNTTAQDEEGVGLIAHAQPNPLDPGSSNYVPTHQRYYLNGQDISTEGTRYDLPYGGSPERLLGRNPTPGQSMGESPYGRLPDHPDPPYPIGRGAGIGMAIDEPEPYQSHVPSSQTYLEQRRAARQNPSEQWMNSSRPVTPPRAQGTELFLNDGRPARQGGNVM